MSNEYAVIMAGGKGERFWPLSTSKKPKQMLSLAGDRPLVAMAVDRLEGLLPPENILIVTNASLVDAMRESMPELPPENIVGEPIGRDTAAAVALASALVNSRCDNGVFAILTADHVMGDLDIFRNALRQSFAAALEQEVIITIGMTPTFPSTGFGYIEVDEKVDDRDGIEFYGAKRFVEKPDQETAESYVSAGNYYWNAGMFIWSVATVQKALEAHTPQLYEMVKKVEPTIGTADFDETLAREYESLEKISVDYAIMEKSDNILTVKGTFSWDDVGSWLALENHFDKDADNNVKIGTCETVDSSGNIIMSRDRLCTLVGVKDMIVVQAEGATLICPRDRAQDVKKMVAQLRETGSYEDVL